MRNKRVEKLVKLALLCAMSLVLMYVVRFPLIPSLPFLEYDMADVPILIGAFMFGPLEGLLLTAVVSLLQALTVSAGSGWVGCAMHFFATGNDNRRIICRGEWMIKESSRWIGRMTRRRTILRRQIV